MSFYEAKKQVPRFSASYASKLKIGSAGCTCKCSCSKNSEARPEGSPAAEGSASGADGRGGGGMSVHESVRPKVNGGGLLNSPHYLGALNSPIRSPFRPSQPGTPPTPGSFLLPNSTLKRANSNLDSTTFGGNRKNHKYDGY